MLASSLKILMCVFLNLDYSYILKYMNCFEVAKHRIPEYIISDLVQTAGLYRAFYIVDDWLEYSTGTCSFPRIDTAILKMDQATSIATVRY